MTIVFCSVQRHDDFNVIYDISVYQYLLYIVRVDQSVKTYADKI